MQSIMRPGTMPTYMYIYYVHVHEAVCHHIYMHACIVTEGKVETLYVHIGDISTCTGLAKKNDGFEFYFQKFIKSFILHVVFEAQDK